MPSLNTPVQAPKKIAVVGSGISGLVCAYVLNRNHQVTVFEAQSVIGGHTATKTVHIEQRDYAVDTGFIVFNDRTYPMFIKLLSLLGVESQATDMGFSVSCRQHNFEYSGTSFGGLFAQRKNLFKPHYWRMLGQILRFNRACTQLHNSQEIPADLTLGDYLEREGYSTFFQQYYILPMVAAIWSSDLATAANIPLLFFIRFFHNHGLLTVNRQPQWYTIKGGSHQYLEPLTKSFKERIRTNCAVQWVKRYADGVTVCSSAGEQQFDEIIFACHSDQALALLADPSADEHAILSAIPYQKNTVSLHMDTRLLPKARAAWASWNYTLFGDAGQSVSSALTYNMNILQRIDAPITFCVSLNAQDMIDRNKLLGEYQYSHPVFTQTSLAAQSAWGRISGHRHTHFCGAYWRNGFHEDGVVSALRVAAMLGEEL